MEFENDINKSAIDEYFKIKDRLNLTWKEEEILNNRKIIGNCSIILTKREKELLFSLKNTVKTHIADLVEETGLKETVLKGSLYRVKNKLGFDKTIDFLKWVRGSKK